MGTAHRVWMDGWQMQCCGDAFVIGSPVSWHLRLSIEGDRSWYRGIIGDAEAEQLTAFEEHHQEIKETERVEGVVRSITAVFCDYAPIPDEPRGRAPVGGTAVFVTKESADGWEVEVHPQVFLGYIVDLDGHA